MVKISEIKELDKIKCDFEKVGCWIRIYGGIRNKGESEHDLDLIVRIMDKKWKNRISEVYLTLKNGIK